jgi:acetolactate synthase-1/2/3 large subunit
LAAHTAGAPAHDLLALTGGAIGQGLPLAVGAAVACPERPVLAIEADGSAMYTLQALWTMAREELDVTVLVCNNRSYAILDVELARVGVGGGSTGQRARDQLDISRPPLDFTHLARGMGVPAVRVRTAEALAAGLREALAEPGPRLVEAMVPSDYTGARLAALPWALKAVRAAPQPLAERLARLLG